MSKRKLPPSPEIRRQHPTSPTPQPKPVSSLSSSLPARHRSSAASSSSPFLALPEEKRPRFWSQPGMISFVNWVATPENYATMSGKKSSGQTLGQAVERLRSYIKEQSGVKWLPSQIRSKLQYARKKYDLAADLARTYAALDTEPQKLRYKMLDICPFYEQLHSVYGGIPLPPAPVHSSVLYSSPGTVRQALSSFYAQAIGGGSEGHTSPREEDRHPRMPIRAQHSSATPVGHSSSSSSGRHERQDVNGNHPQSSQAGQDDTRDDEEDEEIRDQSPEEDAVREPSEATYEMGSEQDLTSDHGHGSEDGAAPEMGEFKAVDSAAASAGRIVWMEQDKERMRQLTRKEQMLEEREGSWALRMLQQQEQHQAMLKKREEESEQRLKRRFEELEEERQQVRAMQQELATQQREFYKERETWLAGYAALKADAAKAAALYHTQN
ncbi:hypothetical protein BGZ72_000386 [Mortierella alpina]|nr:hypothetical protein BGZ72_000386 [Mortierella alpina]